MSDTPEAVLRRAEIWANFETCSPKNDTDEHYNLAVLFARALCARPEVARTPMPVSHFKVGWTGQMEADQHGNWVHRGDYEELEKLYIEVTGCCAPSPLGK